MRFYNEFIPLIKQEIENGETDYHQAVLNIAYAKWQERKDWQYANMISWMESNYGADAALLVLLGKYSQQVCNGGHQQYFDNGYADGVGGFGSSHDKNCPLHWTLKNLFENSPLMNLPNSEKVFKIMEDFKVENSYEEDFEYYIDENLDSRFYEIQEKWMDEIELCVKNFILNG